MSVDLEKEGRIAIITLNRSETNNAIDVQTFRELHNVMLDFRDDPELWVGIVTGAGRSFCAGADIKEMLPFMREHSASTWDMPATIMRGFELWKPLIAAVSGWALGGGLEVALACDIRIAAENSRFGTPEVTLGLIPGWGGTQRLPRLLPSCKAAELLFMGKHIDAQEAYRIGLVNRVVPLEELMTTARQWAETICKAAPLAVRAAKEAMIRGGNMSLADGLRLEETLNAYLFTTEDFAEGTTAFVEKRQAEYKAR